MVRYKWLRAVATGEFTGAHIDSVYMGRGSRQLTTCWIPFGDIPIEQGTLLVAPKGTGANESVDPAYATLDVDAESAPAGATGQYTTDPVYVCNRAAAAAAAAVGKGGDHVWVTEDFRMGDAVILPMDTLHMSTTNTTDRYRISCDTRWQPVADPHDERCARIKRTPTQQGGAL